jgi:hypothetical protein
MPEKSGHFWRIEETRFIIMASCVVKTTEYLISG